MSGYEEGLPMLEDFPTLHDAHEYVNAVMCAVDNVPEVENVINLIEEMERDVCLNF